MQGAAEEKERLAAYFAAKSDPKPESDSDEEDESFLASVAAQRAARREAAEGSSGALASLVRGCCVGQQPLVRCLQPLSAAARRLHLHVQCSSQGFRFWT